MTKSDLQETDGRLQRGDATRERVLDAAERCFAESGFDGVSIRQIAAEAGVTLSVIGFHGGSKQDLFRTVLQRRVEELSSDRQARLEALIADKSAPSLAAIVDAYVTPYLERASTGDPQWRAYARLIARIVSDDRFYPEVGKLYDPVALLYLDAMARARPQAARADLVTALTLTVAAMLSLVASRARIAGLSGREDDGSPLAYRDVLIAFCTGGIDRAATRRREG